MNTDILHKQVWERFIRMPYGHLLDYADEKGDTVIPTAEQLNKGLPNTLAWGLPIENGAFFGGLYLYSLCEKYDFEPDAKLQNEIKILADGLLLLCDVCKCDGCIARGVADDGVSHPPFSSEDQFGPWMLGLWRLMHSTASDDKMRSEIKKRLIRAISGVISMGWGIPTEWKGITRGNYSKKDWRGASKLLFSAAVAREIGVLDDTEFERLANEHPKDSIYNRAEIISRGFAPDMIRSVGLIQFWIDICAQICVKELCKIDVKRAELYKKGLYINASVALEFFKDYERYMEVAGEPLSYDWRPLLCDVREWKDADEAVIEAGRQLGIFFGQMSPGMDKEKKLLGQALFACWIAVFGGDERIAKFAYECLCDAAERVDWSGCGYSFVFAAEGAIYCYQNIYRKYFQ